MRRVLVTGSRGWTDRQAIFDALKAQSLGSLDGITIVNGMCEDGADRFAHEWYLNHCSKWVHEDPHPADWGRACDGNCYHQPRIKNGVHYCPMAGHLRNQDMVDSGADVCLAFPIGTKASKKSRGTWDCMGRARKAGILVINLGIEQDDETLALF